MIIIISNILGNVPHTLVEVYFVQSKSLKQGTVIFPTPTSTLANGRISFNEAVAVKETGAVDHGKIKVFASRNLQQFIQCR